MGQQAQGASGRSEVIGWHAIPVDGVLDRLQVGPDGLTQAEAAVRRRLHGSNRLPAPPPRGPFHRLAGQFSNVLVLVLIGAAAVTAALGHWLDTVVILAVVVINAVVGMVQEGRAEDAIAAIRAMLAPRAAVQRDGMRVSVAAEDLVPGDLVLLEPGDRVPADLRILQAHGLMAQEAILTGESAPVDKDVAEVAVPTPLAERASMLWSGTLVTRGTALGVVVATGPATEIGRIGGLVAGVESLATPLVRKMDRFARGLSLFILAVAAALLAWGHLVQGRDFSEVFVAVVALAVAAVPEGLPAVMTITLAIGVEAMARRRAIVRRLPAIEAVGAVTVICTDKTGTLTLNEMEVTRVETPSGGWTISGGGYGPEGQVEADPDADPAALVALAHAARGCNDARLIRGPQGWQVEGDPMEGALLALAARAGVDGEVPDRHDVLPFDSARRYMAVVADGAGGRCLWAKGAPEALLPACDLDADARAQWHDRAHAMAGRGLRVLALAAAPHDGRALAGDLPEGRLQLLGLVGLIDPPRPGAVQAVADCRAAGITVKMITGDHPATAAAIAAAVGLADPDRVLTGADLAGLDDAGLEEVAATATVFARTSPEDKLRLVRALQARGAQVAMTGDGVNDAPALKRADVGVAMGRGGSEAAREASDLVLADDDFATLAAAVREGRRVHDNLRKVISFELPTSFGEAAVLVIALGLGMALPVTAVQILWVNLITGISLGMALAFEPGAPGLMARPPRRPGEPILPGALVWHVALVTVLFAGGVFALFHHALARGLPLSHARTIGLNLLVVLEIFHILFIRRMDRPILPRRGDRGAGWGASVAVWGAIAAMALAQAAVTYVPVLQRVFGTVALPVADVGLILATGAGFWLILTVERGWRENWR